MDIPDCDCGGCGDCGDCGGGCDCGDCCAFGAGVAAGAAVASGSKDDTCCSFFVGIIILIFIAGIIGGIMYNCSGSSSSPRLSKSEAKIQAAQQKEQQNHWKIIEIQRDHRLFGQNHNTLLENTTSQKRKTVQGVLGKVGEVISLEKQ